MTLKTILTIPDPHLRIVCDPVETVDDNVRALLDDMLETMYEAPGIGLAAPQVGVTKRIVTIDVSKEDEENKPLFLVNPEIIWTSSETSVYEEGCLSIPDFFDEVKRPAACRIRYLDREGQAQELDCDGILSTCVQHEIDHLDGVLFLDHLSKLKRDRVIKKFTKAAKRGELPDFKPRNRDRGEPELTGEPAESAAAK